MSLLSFNKNILSGYIGFEAKETMDKNKKTKQCLGPHHKGDRELPIEQFGVHRRNGKEYIKTQCRSCMALIERHKREAEPGYKARTSFSSEEERTAARRDASNRYKRKVFARVEGVKMPTMEELAEKGMTEKLCMGPSCIQSDGSGTNRPISDFTRGRFNLGRDGIGLSTYCKNCTQPYHKAKAAEYRSTLEGAAREIMAHVRHRMTRLAKRGITEVDIDFDWIIGEFNAQDGICPYYGVPMQPSGEVRFPRKLSPDRLDTRKGYTRDNVVICSLAANQARNECSLSTWMEFCAMMAGNNSRAFKIHPRIQAALATAGDVVPVVGDTPIDSSE